MKKTLIVDDIQENQSLLQALLSANGFDVEQASNGAEALERARRAPPDMIISDILMPVMDGYALCRACKEDERLKNIPFIFYSATYTEPKDQEFALKLGAARFIIKPTEPDKFLALLLEIKNEYEAGAFVTPSQPIGAAGYLKEYNAALIRKLEDKMLRIEEANRVLEQDNTDLKRKEDSLQESETRYRRLFESAKDGILILDAATGMVVDVNPFMMDLLGYSREDFLGKSIWEIGEFRDIVSSYAAFRELQEKEYIRYDDLPLKTHAGRVINVEFVSNVYMVNHEKVIQCNIRDITVRRQAEKNLRFKNLILRTQQEASIDGIIVVDENGMIISYNGRYVEMWGIPSDVIESKSHARALQAVIDKLADPGEFINKVKHLHEARNETSRDEISLKDGRTFDRYSAPMIGEKKRYYGRVWYFRDITERKLAEGKQKKLEDQLRQSQKLEAIGQLSSGIAHDFNNLLGGIMGHAELLKMELNPESPLLHHSEVIISSCENAADLTRQLLSFARKAPVELQKVDLNAFLKQVVGLMDRTIDRRIEIVTRIPEQPVFISGDRNLLENALLNIAINARDAMPEGGHLCISSETVDLHQAALPDEHGEVAEGSYAMISIADTGTGMSKEIKDRIFEPFFTTKGVGKGTGLGLASVYGCVKQHNGYIAVLSQVGIGTRFDLYFPVAASDEMVSSPKSELLLRGKGTLLVVDDDLVYHEILTAIFGNLGYLVRCCAKGAEAVEYYREYASAIQVVILDMNMPKMTGLQCFRHFKEINPGVQVIVSSGYGENRDREAMQKEGVRMFVQKPYKAVELSVKIAELIGQPK